jgi:hypothetical protein
VPVPALGTIVAAAALAALAVPALRRRPRLAPNLGLGSAAAAASWAVLRLAVFTKPVLVTDLRPGVDRAGTALALGLAVAAAALLAGPVRDPAAGTGGDTGGDTTGGSTGGAGTGAGRQPRGGREAPATA